MSIKYLGVVEIHIFIQDGITYKNLYKEILNREIAVETKKIESELKKIENLKKILIDITYVY